MAEKQQKPKQKVLPVGFPVQWFEGADKSNKPWPAVVSAVNSSGSLMLVVQPPRGGWPISKKNCLHISDENLATRPQMRSEFGAWDYVPGLPIPDFEVKELVAIKDLPPVAETGQMLPPIENPVVPPVPPALPTPVGDKGK